MKKLNRNFWYYCLIAGIWLIVGRSDAQTESDSCLSFIRSIGFTNDVYKISSFPGYENGNFYLTTFKPHGFVLVAALNGQFKLAGYSLSAEFDVSKENPLSNGLFDVISSTFNKSSLEKTMIDEEIAPFGTALFNQNTGWNALCPVEQGSRTLVGCVGTAMAIIMHYWKYPYFGRGSSTYIPGSKNEIAVNFENYRYRWDAMSNNVPDSYNTTLLYHCAAAVKTTFGVAVSSLVNSNNISYALKVNFGYNTECRVVRKGQYTETQWNNLIKEQMKKKIPVLYIGGDGDNAHAFVIEGYQKGKFYINWGWGGNSNGYFDIGFLYVPPNDFRKDNKAFIDIEPKKLFPPTGITGSILGNQVTLKWDPPVEKALLCHYVLPYRDVARYNSKGSQRMTMYDPAAFGFKVPVSINGIGHSFYIDSLYPGDSTFKYVVYKNNSSEVLYQTPGLKAFTNSEIMHSISTPVSVSDSFCIAVAPNGTDTLPPSYSSMVEKESCFSQYGEPGNWTKFNYAAPGGRELHTCVYVTGTPAKGKFPKGGYLIFRNGNVIDTVRSLEECTYIDNKPASGNNIYRLVSYKDTAIYQSTASDSIVIQNGTSSTLLRNSAPTMSLHNHTITFSTDYRGKLLIELFSIDGRRLAVLDKYHLNASGVYAFAIPKSIKTSSGYTILRIKTDGRQFFKSLPGVW
jgi:hypothetical protein